MAPRPAVLVAALRVLAPALIVAVAGLSNMMTAQETVSPGRRFRRAPIIATLSDLMPHSPLAACRATDSRDATASSPLRIATWNIHAARSAPITELAAELAAMEADIVALQEVDVRTRRGGFVDEPQELSKALGVHYAFAASIKWDEGDYGLAVLSRWPLVAVRRHRLSYARGTEPRILLEVTVCARGRPLHLFTHHADRRIAQRATGFAELRHILQPHVGRGVLVVGDFNEYPDGPGVRSLIETGLVDVGAGRLGNTVRTGRVDYVFADAPMARLISSARLWLTDKSDHQAVLAELAW